MKVIRRFFIFFIFLWIFAIHTPASFAQTAPIFIPATGQQIKDMSIEDILKEGTYSLRAGRHLDQSVLLFMEAVRRKPNDITYQNYLTQATIAQVFALSKRIELHRSREKNKERNKFWKDRWEAIQNNKFGFVPSISNFRQSSTNSESFLPLESDETQSIEKLKILTINARKQWEETYALLGTDNTEKVREIRKEHGWCALMMMKGPYAVLEQKDKQIEMFNRMRTSLKEVYDSNPTPYQARVLGDALVSAIFDYEMFQKDKLSVLKSKADDKKYLYEGIEYLKLATKKARDKAELWYYIGLLYSVNEDKKEATECIFNAYNLKKFNSYYIYEYIGNISSDKKDKNSEKENNIMEFLKENQYKVLNDPIVYQPASVQNLSWTFPKNILGMSIVNMGTVLTYIDDIASEFIKENNIEKCIFFLQNTARMSYKISEILSDDTISISTRNQLTFLDMFRNESATYSMVLLKKKPDIVLPSELDLAVSFVPENRRLKILGK